MSSFKWFLMRIYINSNNYFILVAKEHPCRNHDENLLRHGSDSLAVRLRMLESKERGRAKAVSGRDELAEENYR